MRTVHRETDLPLDAEVVFAFAKRVATYEFLTKPRGDYDEDNTATLSEGKTIVLRLPHRHTIEIVEVDDATRTIRTSEHGGPVKSWKHTITVVPLTDGRCRYTDHVEIDAGALSPIVCGIANQLYAHRQRRWHKLAEAVK